VKRQLEIGCESNVECVSLERLFLYSNEALSGQVSHELCATRTDVGRWKTWKSAVIRTFNVIAVQTMIARTMKMMIPTMKMMTTTACMKLDDDGADQDADCVDDDDDEVVPVVESGYLLVRVSFDDGAAMLTQGTPQIAAYEWLKGDPELPRRSETDAVESYVLVRYRRQNPQH